MTVIRVELNFDEKIFDRAARTQVQQNFITAQASDFATLTKQRMIAGPHSGTPKPKGRGRRSAPGQRPAPDTMTLVNAIDHRAVSESKAEVYIAERMNPRNGARASFYGDILQTKLGRPIMTQADAEEAERKMVQDANLVLRELL